MITFRQFLTEQVTVRNSTSGKVPQEKIDIVTTAIPKMLQALKIPNAKIVVYIGGDIGRENAHAGGSFATGNGAITFNPTFLKKAELHDLLDTTAHELIHIWQDVAGHMDSRDTYDWWFRGKKYKSSTQWANAPWEHEAVLNSWALVQKAGLAGDMKRSGLDTPHFKAKLRGKEANLFIKDPVD